MVDVPGPLAVTDLGGGVLEVALDRPTRRNAIDGPTLGALVETLTSAPVVVLTSSTDGMFCAGLDLGLDTAEREEVSDRLYGLYAQLVQSPSLLVTALTGPAVGAGAQLLLAADVRIAQPDAWVQFPGVTHGLVVGAWGLPSLVGRGRALRACATAERIDAATALDWGLLDQLDPDPRASARALATALADRDAHVLAALKRVVGEASGLSAALASERRANQGAWAQAAPATAPRPDVPARP